MTKEETMETKFEPTKVFVPVPLAEGNKTALFKDTNEGWEYVSYLNERQAIILTPQQYEERMVGFAEFVTLNKELCDEFGIKQMLSMYVDGCLKSNNTEELKNKA